MGEDKLLTKCVKEVGGEQLSKVLTADNLDSNSSLVI